MLKSKLYWKVIANFGLLLIILTAMTLLTLNILSQIQGNFRIAAADTQLLNKIEIIRDFLVQTPEAANQYLLTGSTSARLTYERGWKEFDSELADVRKDVSDTIAINTLQEIRRLFFEWMTEIGDKKVLIRENNLKPEQFQQALRELAEKEASGQYLNTARASLAALYQRRMANQPVYIERAANLTVDVGTFIGLVNILLALFAIALGFVLTRSLTKPIRLLKQGTQNIMSGKFEPIVLHRSDELGELAQDFNKMSTMLNANYTRLKAYSELVTALNEYSTVEDVESKSLELLCQHSSSSVGALYTLDEETEMLRLAAGYALKDQGARVRAFAMGEGLPGEAARLQRTLEITGVEVNGGFGVTTGLVELVPKYMIAVPLMFQDKLLGVMVLGSMNPYDDVRKDIINNSMPQIGVAITNARNFEAAQKLSREVAKKNEELNYKNNELEKAYRVKSDFLASMSHELRTPLNSIIGFSSVLLGPNGDPLTPDQKKALEKVLRNGKHLLQLINDILDFSKLEAGRMTVNVEPGDIHDIVSNSIMTIETVIAAKNIQLKEEIEPNLPVLNTDTLKIKQILVNLLSNAAKFTDQGEISVKVGQRNGMVYFSVKDSGIGIESHNLGKVFEEFQQIDGSNTRKYKGTGLGLPISRRLARLLGGDLTVESEFGKGSTFTLSIPPVYNPAAGGVQERPAAPSPRRVEEAPPPVPVPAPTPLPVDHQVGKVEVLCIDDDPDVIEILRKYLVPEGYSVAGATSGDQGIQLAAQLKPSVITLDIMMPHKDGWQVLRELKANPSTKDIPVIIHSIIDNKPLAMSMGAVDLMPKPVEPKRLLAMVEAACKSKDEFVLIVDDNEDYTLMLKHLLEKDGFNSRIANSGKEALAILQKEHPAMILLDLVMPEMDGMEVVQKLAAHEKWKNIPVVILSGKELSKEERERLDTHIKDFMKKAEFSGEKISHTIKKILGNRRN
ncbi:MAG TPA: response regulator [Bacteroidota bacterium]|nr:response regulator [Bacteroidota bacterium]